MGKKITLLIDAFINLILGVLLLLFNPVLVKVLGVPGSSSFYPNILGGIFIGITISLLIEAFRGENSVRTGLGLIGAVSINLCGGTVLILWLLFGDLDIPSQGYIFLWTLALILMFVSSIELVFCLRSKKTK